MSRPGTGRDLFFEISKGIYRLYDPDTDPTPIYLPHDGRVNLTEHPSAEISQPAEVLPSSSGEDESGSAEFAYERDLQSFLARNLDKIEPGMRLFTGDIDGSTEYNAGGRRIDILATDAQGATVVIELKVSRGYDRVLGQLSRYMAWTKKELSPDTPVRGIIIAREISDDLRLAASLNPLITLFEYELAFTLKPAATV